MSSRVLTSTCSRRARLPKFFLRPQLRSYFQPPPPPPPNSSPSNDPQRGFLRISTVFTALLLLGIGTTSYGIYEFYTALTMWPQELRGDLRAGIKARNQGDLDLSERYIRRAWETSLTLPISTLSPQPHLKISGIAILLGSVLEMGDRPKAAYEVYEQALTYLRDTVPASSTSSAPIPPEEPTDLLATEDERVLRLRAVALASKLGEMAEVYDLGNETEEKWLSWAVEEVLRVVAAASSTSPSSPSSSSWTTPGDVQGSNPLADLDLPPWIQKTDIGAPMEALGAFYARTGRFEYAYTLYTRALGILLPAPRTTEEEATYTPPSVSDRCRAAQIMSNLSSIVLHSPSHSNIEQAEKWAGTALGLIKAVGVGQDDEESGDKDKGKWTKKAEGEDEEGVKICENALGAVLFNLGMLREMSKDPTTAHTFYVASLTHSKKVGMREGVVEAKAALRRLEREGKKEKVDGEVSS